MLLVIVDVDMLKKKLGAEVIDKEWRYLGNYFKIPSTINILEGCERIGDYAFKSCWELKRVVIPEGCKSIGIAAFWGSGLKKAIIPESVEDINDYAFAISSLVRVIIPKGCKRVGAKVFEFCNRLEEVVVSENVEEIGNFAFDGCRKATIILKKHKRDFVRIGSCAFLGVRDVKEEVRN